MQKYSMAFPSWPQFVMPNTELQGHLHAFRNIFLVILIPLHVESELHNLHKVSKLKKLV